jgi:hypothetical protein
MVIITADGPLQSLLQGVKEPAEVRDKNGKVLGHYTPVLTPEEAAWYDKTKKLFDLEEAERIFEAERDQWRPLREFWKELKGQKDAS